MPYAIRSDESDQYKVTHRLDEAKESKEALEEETGHTFAIEEFRMNA